MKNLCQDLQITRLVGKIWEAFKNINKLLFLFLLLRPSPSLIIVCSVLTDVVCIRGPPRGSPVC